MCAKSRSKMAPTLLFMCEENDNSLILSRLSTRESSTLTFASVAASASLVILTLMIEPGVRCCYAWLEWVGVVFAVLGIIFREATILLDRAEFCMLTSRFRGRLERTHRSELYWWVMPIRRIIVRFFLCLPVAAWVAFAFSTLFGAIVAVAAVGYSILSTYLQSDPECKNELSDE
jgi:hypothetical protein